MLSENIVRSYSDLPATDKCRLLCYIGNHLTAAIRFNLITDPTTSVNFLMLKNYAEFFHQTFGQMASLVQGNDDRYPDDLFVQMLSGLADQGGFTAPFTTAWNDALRYVHRTVVS